MNTSSDKPRRRWFSFSLRTLFGLITVSCIWLGVQVKWIHNRNEEWKWAIHYPFMPDDPPEKPFPWSLRLFGEKPHRDSIVIVAKTADDEARARRLAALFPEAYVYVGRGIDGEDGGMTMELIE